MSNSQEFLTRADWARVLTGVAVGAIGVFGLEGDLPFMTGALLCAGGPALTGLALLWAYARKEEAARKRW